VSGYRLHPEAFIDLTRIWEFIAKDNVDVADRVREDIFDTIRLLTKNPNIGHRRPDLTSRPLRFRGVFNYLIAYAPEGRPLLIVAVIHGSRNPAAIATILGEREA